MTTAHAVGLRRRMTAPLRYARKMRALPLRVALFNVRARIKGRQIGDDAVKAAIRPDDLAVILELARGRRTIVELGTCKAWTAISLALADHRRRVITYDPIVQHPREHYLALVSNDVRERITLIDQPGAAGPAPGVAGVELLLIDSSHRRAPTVDEYEAWRAALAPGAIVIFDDYNSPEFPEVRQAVDHDLKLQGRTEGLMFIHQVG